MSDAAKDDTDVLFPGEDVPVKLRGQAAPETVRVEPFYSTQLKPAAKKIRPLANSLFSVVAVEGKSITLKYSDDFGDRLFDLIENGADALIDLVSFAIGKPVDWFDNVSPDGLVDLAQAIVRQNEDFFKRLLGKLVPAMAGETASAAVGAPSTPA